ncbi:MAG: response regulator [Gemmatimonadetes bacterium]|nr:response regulator [Gemmatimonadota bacterium]
MSRPPVVVVNDDPVQLQHLGTALKGAGYEVTTFLSAADLLAGLSGRTDVGLFVVDLHMPEIDGWKLCRLLRSPDFGRYNATPILVVSATFTGDDVAGITRELGANAFLEAPFDAGELREYVSALLGGTIPQKAQSVLGVDDDPELRRVLARAFAAHGYLVREAATVGAAMDELAAARMDLVLLDYHLPDGPVEGVLDLLKVPGSRTSVLVMTGDTDPILPVRLLSRGADGYLRKPFEPAFAIELARKAGRQRALLRIESLLESRTRELKASEERYRTLFETIPDLVMVIGAQGHVVQVNPDGLAYLAAGPDEVLGRHIIEVASAEAARELSRWIGARQKEEGPERLETELQATDGRKLEVELTARPLQYHGERTLVIVGRDLAERRRAEEERRRIENEMRHAQRLESLGVLAGGVAHDFNNLLVGVLGNASLAMMDLPEDSPARESVRQIELAARRAAELTQQILAFAGKARVVFQELDLSELVREMGQLLEPAVSKKARLSTRLATHLPLVRADAGQMRQVVMNLIMNASDALGGQPGDIGLTTSVVDLPQGAPARTVGGTSPAPGRYVSLQVTDTGCGMDEETASRIFEPFFATKFAGRGLGLASTLGVLRAHGGHIQLRTRAGTGTTVTVLLPALADPHRVSAAPRTSAETPPCTGGTVLVIDDEAGVRGLARRALARAGFTVLEASDGLQGLDMATANDGKIDVILLDVSMPELDGPEVLRALRERGGLVPVLMSSGYPPEGINTALGAGGEALTEFLRKPYTPAELHSAVDTLLRRRAV